MIKQYQDRKHKGSIQPRTTRAEGTRLLDWALLARKHPGYREFLYRNRDNQSVLSLFVQKRKQAAQAVAGIVAGSKAGIKANAGPEPEIKAKSDTESNHAKAS